LPCRSELTDERVRWTCHAGRYSGGIKRRMSGMPYIIG
jgi:hypothetical protein